MCLLIFIPCQPNRSSPHSFTHSSILIHTLIHTHSHTHPHSFTHSSILIHTLIHTKFTHSYTHLADLQTLARNSPFTQANLNRELKKLKNILLMTQKPKGIIPLLFIKIWFITKNQLRSGLVEKVFTGRLSHLVEYWL